MNKYKKNDGKQGGKLNNFIIIAGLFFIASSLFLLAYSLQKDRELKEINIAKVENFKKEREKHNKDYLEESDKFSKHTVGDLKNEIASSKEMIGYISIDKVNVVLPIYNGTYSAILRKGVGVLEDMDTLNGEKGSTTVLAGHRGGYNNKSTFKEIDSLDIEDTFVVGNKSGDMKYKVIGKIVVEPDDWSQLKRIPGKAQIILLTCHPYPINNKRLLVIAERVEF